MQSEVFKGELDSKHIEGLKEFLTHECDSFDAQKAKKGINFEAFMSL